MQLHQLKSNIKQKSHRRRGRGGKRGTYSGRGIKGQKSRAGRKLRPAWRDLIKQIPKRRGCRFKPTSSAMIVVNLDFINKSFKEGEIISPVSLCQKGLIDKIKGRIPDVKILGGGDMSKKLSFTGVELSKGAINKVKKAGGNIK